MVNTTPKDEKNITNTKVTDNKASIVRERIYNIGIIALFLVLGFALFFSHRAVQYPTGEEKDLGKLIWSTFFSVTSGAMIIIESVVAVLYIKSKHNCSKTTVITFSVLVYILVMFDNVAIEYPASPSLIVLVNFCVIIFCVAYVLFKSIKKEPTIVIQGDHKTAELRRAISGTENKKLIAVQMYKVRTEHLSVSGKDKTRFIVNAGESFTREGHDINSVSSLVYELDRADVDEFTAILKSYHLVEQFGNDDTRRKLIESIDQQISLLGDRLKNIDDQNREVTKEDCCIARLLVIYMSFKRILVPDPAASETRADYIGEISLNDGDLKLSVDTERKLFTQVRTGLLAAALLGMDSRYVFHYRKDGLKQGRKYCASQLACEENYSEGVISSQEMDICLFTVEENSNAAIAPYVFTSITKREALIQEVLNKLKKGDEHDEKN